MGEYLETVRQELGAGRVTAQALVLLFREAEEAEQRRDLQALEQTLELAKQSARAADETLSEEAERLIALCEELLQRTGAPTAEAEAPCPGCGRPVVASAVRCRACGTLLV